MIPFLQALAQKGGEVIAATAMIFGAFSQPNVALVNPSPVLVLPAPTSDSSTAITVSTAQTPAATTASTTNKTSVAAAKKISVFPPPAEQKNQMSAPVARPANLRSFPKVATVQSILDGTSFSLNHKTDGRYWVSLHTDTGYASGFDWGFSDTFIGGTALVPRMNASFLCDPQWIPAAYNSADQNPIFDINTSYTCQISITDSMLRTADKKISFKTENGRLIVKSSTLGTVLKSGNNSNGFVFDNQSNSKINITGVVVDASFRSLNISSPVVLRFLSPDNESLFSDFQIQNSPADPVRTNLKTTSGITVPLPFAFTVNARSQRMLPVKTLGVQPLNEIGINPEIDVALKQINYDNQEIKVFLMSPAISWSCIPYDSAGSGGNLPTEQNCR